MNEIIYLEPDSEITAVIDRIKKAESDAVALVIPRGATLAQSIVNLKLLKKAAEGLGKEISLVTNDRISRNLGSQIGITVFSRVSEADRVKPIVKAAVPEPDEEEDDDSFKVNNYYRNKEKEEEEAEAQEELPVIAAANEESTDTFDDDFSDDTDDTPVSPEKDLDGDYTPGEHESDDSDAAEEEAPKYEAKKIPAAQYKKSNLKHTRKPIIIISSVFVVILLIASFIFLPYASASVQIKTEDYSTELAILADKTVTASNVDKLTIPATITDLDKDLSKDFSSTGTKDVGTKATGTVNIYNVTADKLGLPAGTKLNASGKIFTLDALTNLPASTAVSGSTTIDEATALGCTSLIGCRIPGSASGIKVTALETGESYNISSKDILTVAGFVASKVYASTTAAFSGGITKVIKTVSATDIEKAAAAVKDELTTAAKKELTDKVAKNNLTITGADIKTEIASETSTKKADEEAETFNYSVKAKLYVLGFSESELKKLADDSVLSKVGSDKMILNPDKAEISYKVTANDLDAGTVKINASFKGKIGSKLDAAAIKTSIKNKSVSKAETIIKSNENVESVTITTWPKFYKRIPMLKNRVKVTFDYAK